MSVRYYNNDPSHINPPTTTRTTITTALADIPNDLTGSGIQELELDAETYSENINISKINGSSSNKIVIHPITGAEAKGVFGGSGHPILVGSITVNSHTVELHDFEIQKTYAGMDSICIYVYSGKNLLSENTLLNMNGCPYPGRFHGYWADGTVKCYKCIVWNSDLISIGGEYYSYVVNDGVLNAVNCGAIGNLPSVSKNISYYRWWQSSIGIITADNCYGFVGTASNRFYAPTVVTNCASDDSTGSPGYINLTSSQYSFINSTSGNFHLKRDSVLLGAGISQSSLFTKDWDDQTILEWMMGPDYETPTCWSYKAKYKNSDRIFSTGGSDKYPSTLKVPKNVDISTGRMTDEDLLIDPSSYSIEQ